MKFLAKITESGLSFQGEYNEARWQDFCKENLGKYVKIEKPESIRSGQQNNFYWLYLDVIGAETGNESEYLNEFFKRKLLPKKYVVIHGKEGDYEIEVRKSTTQLSKVEMGEYIEKICAITGVPIPDPENAGYIK